MSTISKFTSARGGSVMPWLLLAMAAGLIFTLLLLRPISDRIASAGADRSVPLATLQLQPLTTTGEELSLDSLRGQVVLVNFWGTWCHPCRIEFPRIVEFYERYRDRNDVRVVSVSCRISGDEGQHRDELRDETASFLQRMQTDLPVYVDLDFRTRGALKRAVGFDGYPTTMILDNRGQIRGVWTGSNPGSENEMAALVDRLLAESAALVAAR